MTVLEELDTAVVELDRDNHLRLVNAAAEQCLAARREKLLDTPIERQLGLPQELLDAIARTRDDQRPRKLLECPLAAGLYNCSVRLLDDGQVLLEFHSLERARQKQQLEQREVQTGLLDLLRRNLGHEIRNPLGGIRGAAQLIAAELDEPELGNLAELIMREVDRIDELIQRFWQPEPQQSSLDIHRSLEEALELLSVEISDLSVIERDYDPSIPQLRGDALALRRIFLNLVRNAWQAGATEITVRTRIEHGTALLQSGQGTVLRVDVEDDGEGVPEELRALLFLPMVTGRRDGTGLGLALAQQIAASHGGLLTYRHLPDGSLFTLRLPLPEARKEAVNA